MWTAKPTSNAAQNGLEPKGGGHVCNGCGGRDARIARYGAIAKDLKQQHPGHPDLPFWLITTSYGLHEAHALRVWCDETRDTCRAIQQTQQPESAIRKI